MLYHDRMEYGDAPTRLEFKTLMRDPEFALSFYAVNNPTAIISNMRSLGLLQHNQNVNDDEVYNFIAAFWNAGRVDTVKKLLRGVSIIPDAPFMTEPQLDALIDMESEFSKQAMDTAAVWDFGTVQTAMR